MNANGDLSNFGDGYNTAIDVVAYEFARLANEARTARDQAAQAIETFSGTGNEELITTARRLHVGAQANHQAYSVALRFILSGHVRTKHNDLFQITDQNSK